MKRAIIAAAFVLLGFVFPGIANAETVPGCASAAQIGSTGHVKFGGNTIASVKQFAGCGSNYGYVYVWESFRNSGKHWMLTTAVAVYGSAGDGTPDDFKGGDHKLGDPVQLWSKPAATLSKCTAAYGMVGIHQYDNYLAYSSKRC